MRNGYFPTYSSLPCLSFPFLPFALGLHLCSKICGSRSRETAIMLTPWVRIPETISCPLPRNTRHGRVSRGSRNSKEQHQSDSKKTAGAWIPHWGRRRCAIRRRHEHIQVRGMRWFVFLLFASPSRLHRDDSKTTCTLWATYCGATSGLLLD